MPYRKTIFTVGEFYHIYNRAVGHEIIFEKRRQLSLISSLIDFYRYPQLLRYSQYKILPTDKRSEYIKTYTQLTPLVEIYAFSIMPNHYHLELKQTAELGIQTFIKKLQGSYSLYFNLKSGRHGTLFTNPFKAKHIDNNESFIHLSRYIHLNRVTSFLSTYDDLITSPWSSYSHYMNKAVYPFVTDYMIQNHFGSSENYAKFVSNHADFQKKMTHIYHLLFD